MTREGIVVIAVLTGVTLIAMIVPGKDEPPMKSVKITESVALSVESQNKREIIKTQEINKNTLTSYKIADEDKEIRNPFTLAHEKRGETAKVSNTEISNALSNPSLSATDVSKKAKIQNSTKTPKAQEKQETQTKVKPTADWKLTGIVIIGDKKTAIISHGDENMPLKLGGSFDNKIIVAIEENYILYSDNSGGGRLDLSMP